jgi:rhodanese-related sulfurtransferase
MGTPGSNRDASIDADRYRKCLELARCNQAKFDVPTLSSQELLQMDPSSVVVVDVRTRPEQQVSRIPGSVTLKECHKILRGSPAGVTVVTYCTVGYRSGMEARRMQQLYPSLTVYNLDGIVAYSHALSASKQRDQLGRLHTFGSTWDLAPVGVETTYFRGVQLTGRLMQVGWTSFWRKTQDTVSRMCC